MMKMGFDPVWFGVICVVMVEVGTLTPPFGLTVFTAKGIAGSEVETGDVFRATIPFVFLQLIIVVLLSIFPQIVLFLPSNVKF
jgi:TRAP-type mannitol/chloroaromatic compound transport system permease large subunit